MKVEINFNNEIQNFETLKEAEKFLNSALYYCDELFLTIDFSEVYNYSSIKKETFRFLLDEAKFYNKVLNVSQSWN